MATDIMNVRMRFTPASSSGAIITMPSGMFCSAMPKLTVHDASSPSLMLTPAAMPSGNLWMAMAMTNRRMWLRVELLW